MRCPTRASFPPTGSAPPRRRLHAGARPTPARSARRRGGRLRRSRRRRPSHHRRRPHLRDPCVESHRVRHVERMADLGGIRRPARRRRRPAHPRHDRLAELCPHRRRMARRSTPATTVPLAFADIGARATEGIRVGGLGVGPHFVREKSSAQVYLASNGLSPVADESARAWIAARPTAFPARCGSSPTARCADPARSTSGGCARPSPRASARSRPPRAARYCTHATKRSMPSSKPTREVKPSTSRERRRVGDVVADVADAEVARDA